MARMPKRYAQAREVEIMEAAKRCFARDGYRRTTMGEVAAEAGLSVGALYRYFPSKEAMFDALIGQASRIHASYWHGIEEDNPRRRLEAFIEQYFEQLGDPACRSDLVLDLRFLAEALDSPLIADAMVCAVGEQAKTLSQLLAEAKGYESPDSLTCAQSHALISLLRGASHQLLTQDDLDLVSQFNVAISTVSHWIESNNEHQVIQ